MATDVDVHTSRWFIGSLPFSATEDDLRQWFEADGIEIMECKIIRDRETNESKGYGFISAVDEFTEKIQSCNGQPMNGRRLIVDAARPCAARPV